MDIDTHNLALDLRFETARQYYIRIPAAELSKEKSYEVTGE